MLQFIKESEIDYAGVFPYYREENTASYFMKNQVSEFVKKRRKKKIDKIQQKITTKKAKYEIGQEEIVLVDYFDENTGEFCGHSQKASPSVDFGVRFVDNGNIKISQFVKVKITGFDGCDYKGEIV